MTKSLKRKEHSNKDFKFMDQCYQKLNKYFPYSSYTDKRYDHLVLMQDLVKAFPPFEITGGAETKKAYWYGTLCGYYACLQNQSDNAIKREAIKEHESAKGTN
jgi:hypothetical protein